MRKKDNTDPEKKTPSETEEFFQSLMYRKDLGKNKIKEMKERVSNPYGFTCWTENFGWIA